ncbi:MAG: pyridoxal phosphate-dependent aminotransferase, partial [Planctomycetota bacterium]
MPALQLSDAVARIKPSATIAAATKAAELKAQGVSVLSFTLGEPDFDTPAHICEAATQAMAEGHTHYTPAGGTVELKEAICRAYARDYGLEYTPANVVCSNGAKHSIHNVLAALCGPGDEVVIPTPYWVSYADLVELTGAKAVLVETTEASGWVLAPEQLREAVTPATKLVMLNSPTNPTGAVYPVETLKALGEVIVEKDLWCLTDEIYEKLIYPGYEFAPFAGFGDEVKARTIVVSGVSKAYAMTGWRMGWAISPDPALAKAMTKLQSQETSCPSSVTQKATIAALDGPQDCVAEMLSAFT